MKKLKIFTFTILFLFLFNINVSAGTGIWAERIVWSDSTTSTGSVFTVFGENFSRNLTQSPTLYINRPFSSWGYGISAKVVVSDENLFTGSVVSASLYILTSFPMTTGKLAYSSTIYDSQNDYVTISKISDNVSFRTQPGYFGTLYKITFNFKNQDCLDSEFDGKYVCYSDAYTRNFTIGYGNPSHNWDYGMEIYNYGEVTYTDLVYSQPSSNDVEDLAKLSVWDTIKALPGKLLSWFTSLPSNIWNGLKTGFNWVVDSIGNLGTHIINLPGHIWNGLKTGFNWIVDSISNLFNFFKKDDDIDLSIIDNMVGGNINNLGEMSTMSSGWLPSGPVDTVLNLPFTFLNNLNTNLSKSCKEVTLPLPYVKRNLPLPCVNSIYGSITGLNTWISSVSLIMAGLLLFKYLINLYKWVDATLSFRENNHLDNWGGI